MAKNLTPKDFVDLWTERLKRSYRAKKHLMTDWRVLVEFYEGRYFSHKGDNDRVSTNLLFSVIRQMMATLYFQNPKMYFKGLSELGGEVAPVMEEYVTLVRRIIDAEGEEREVLLHALLFGTGIMKHGYNAQYGIDTPLSEDSVSKNFERPQMPGTDDFLLSQGIFTEHDLKVRGGYPWVKVIHPFDFFLDSEAMDFDEARWYGHRFRRPHADVVRDSRYDEEAREEVQPTGNSEWFVDDIESGEDRHHQGHGADRFHDSSIVSLYEIYDMENREIIVIADNGTRPLMRIDDPLGLVDSPYAFLKFYQSETSPWGLSYGNQFAELVEAFNKIQSDNLDHLGRYGHTRGIYRRGVMSEAEAKRIAEARNGELVAVDWDAGQPLSHAIETLPQETISPDAYRLATDIRSGIDEVSGVNENARGGSKRSETATEANIINQQGGLRTADMLYQVTRFLRGSTRRLVAIMKKFWPPERAIMIFGADGQPFELVHLRQDQVLSDYEVDIEPGSTERIDKPVRVRQIVDTIDKAMAMEPFLNRQGAGFNWPMLGTELLKVVQLSPNPEKFIILPQPQQPVEEVVQSSPTQVRGVTPNALGQLPSEGEGFDSGRMLSEAGAT